MCGIAGIHAYHYAAGTVDRGELARMSEALRARGPDGAGHWYTEDGRVGLAHRRLAIIDLDPRADQPMVSSCGRLVLVYNGEIYNYLGLRAELERAGHHFRTRSDTEVILALYRARGVDMLRALRGMYAFGLWDAAEGRLLLARDPYGIKPLYYADDGWCLRFASQVRALLAGGRVSRAPEPAGQVGFLLWGSVPEPYTCWQAIRALPAGHALFVDALGPHAPFAHTDLAAAWRVSAPYAAESVRDALRESAAAHLLADVPVGCFLSAGIDSGALLGAMTEVGGRPLAAVTIGFEEFAGRPEDEVPLARRVARRYGAEHHVRWVSQAEFEADLPALLAAMDQPSIDGVNTWFVAKASREQGLKVAVSGIGGDELFGGYPSFRQLPRWRRRMAWTRWLPGLGLLTAGPLRLAAAWSGGHPKLAGVVRYAGSWAGAYLLKRALFLPEELYGLWPEDFVRQGLERLDWPQQLQHWVRPGLTEHAQVSLLESRMYLLNQLLRDSDWASMAHGLELRTPWVDRELLRRVAPHLGQPTEPPKAPLIELPTTPLPAAVVARPKTGFGTPVAQWQQSSPLLQAWKRHRRLRAPHTPWARRYAMALAELHGLGR